MEQNHTKPQTRNHRRRLTGAWASVIAVALVVGAILFFLYCPPQNLPTIKLASPDIIVDVPPNNPVPQTNVINVTAPVTARFESPEIVRQCPTSLADGMRPAAATYTSQEKNDALAALMLINHINWVVTKVKTHNNPMVLEEEYKNISQNSLLLDAIKDEEVITLICDIMDAIVELRIDAKKRDMLKEEIDQAMSDALYDAVSGVSVSGTTPLGMAVSALTSVATAAANYKRAKRNLERNMKTKTFALDEAKMRYLNELNKSLLKNYWFVMQKYGIKDPYRVTEDDIAYLIDRTKDTDVERRLRFLVAKKDRYEFFPNYWYWRGETEYELGHAKEADESLAVFQSLQKEGCKILRYDSTAANVAMLRAKLLVDANEPNTQLLREQLKIVDKNSSDDEWQKKYFCAMVYAQYLKDIDEAERVLQPAIDKMESDRSGQLVNINENFEEQRLGGGNKVDVPAFGDALYACKTLLLESRIATVSDEKRYSLLAKICDSETASAREKLFCYCSMGYDQALGKLRPDIKAMRAYSEGKKLKLLLPMSWVVTRDGAPEVHLIKGNAVDLVKLDFDSFYNAAESGDRELAELDGRKYAKVNFNCDWKETGTVIVTFRYYRNEANGVVRDCYQIAVAFDVSRHNGHVTPSRVAFGLWTGEGWKNPTHVAVMDL